MSPFVAALISAGLLAGLLVSAAIAWRLAVRRQQVSIAELEGLRQRVRGLQHSLQTAEAGFGFSETDEDGPTDFADRWPLITSLRQASGRHAYSD